MQNDPSAPCGSCSARSAAGEPTSGIARRTFLVQSAMVAAAVALAACGAAGTDATAPSLSGTTTLKVSDYPSLATVGGVALVTIASNPVAVVRTGTSSFVALSRVCPHQGSTVNQNGSGFLCPNHGAQFSSTGTWVGGQQTNSLRSYTTTYDAAAGTISISN